MSDPPDPLTDYQAFDVALSVSSATRLQIFPVVMLESVAFGMATVFLLLYIYVVLRQQHRGIKEIARSVCLSVFFYGVLAVHWALTLHYTSAFLSAAPQIDWNLYTDYGNPLAYDLRYFQLFVTEAVLVGTLTALLLAVLAIFMTEGSFPNGGLNKLPLVAILVMYASSVAHWIAGLAPWVRFDDTYQMYFGPSNTPMSVALGLTVLCSDAIVLWRTCAVWLNQRAVFGFAMLLFATSAGIPESSDDAFGAFTVFNTIPGFIAMGASLLCNIFSSCAIGYKAWQHRRRIRKHLKNGPRRFLTERIMTIFIESGVTYTCIWVVYIIASIVNFLHIGTFGARTPWSLLIYTYCICPLIASYPTIIILLVMLEKTSFAEQAMPQRPSRVVLPPVPLTISTMIQTPAPEVLVIGDGNFDSQQIATVRTQVLVVGDGNFDSQQTVTSGRDSAESWTSDGPTRGSDPEKPANKPTAEAA